VATFDSVVPTLAGSYSALVAQAAGLPDVSLATIVVSDPVVGGSGNGQTLPKKLPSKVAAKNGDTLVALWFLS
jgi:hypothetical protein